jgi:hypothetical protein
MTAPLDAAGQAAATASAIVDNANALGLTWRLRPATVAVNSQIVVDGDSEPIDWTDTLIGPVLVGQRVWVITVPPSGNYIIGFVDALAPIGAHVARGITAQNLPSGAATLLNFNLNLFDTSGFAPSLPSVVIPAGLGGLYALTASVEMTATGTRNFGTILINGSRFVRSSLDPGEDFIGISGTRTLAAGDSITVDAFQNSGGLATMIGELWLFRL